MTKRDYALLAVVVALGTAVELTLDEGTGYLIGIVVGTVFGIMCWIGAEAR